MPEDRQKETIRTTSGHSTQIHKDVSAKSDIVQFLERQTIRTNPFGHNVSGEHLYRRVERISAAIYLLTSHIPTDEPVREIIRKQSIELIDLALSLRGTLRVLTSETLKDTQAMIRKLISLSEILTVGGFVSVQNVESLIEALDEAGNLLITSQRSVLSEDIIITRDDLVPRLRAEETKPRGRRSITSPVERELPQGSAGTPLKDKPVFIGNDEKVEKDISIRGQRIMDILKSGNFFGIKDIVSNLPEYSEKMIQRELSELVSLNQVKKIGAKRWSRYALLRS